MTAGLAMTILVLLMFSCMAAADSGPLTSQFSPHVTNWIQESDQGEGKASSEPADVEIHPNVTSIEESHHEEEKGLAADTSGPAELRKFPQPDVCKTVAYCHVTPEDFGLRAEKFGACGVAVQAFNNCKIGDCKGEDLDRMEEWMGAICADIRVVAAAEGKGAIVSPSFAVALIPAVVAVVMA